MEIPETAFEPSIPKGLVNTIQSGRCVAFVGSGFSGAAGFPTWESLLRDLAARPEAENIRPQIEERLKDKTSHAFDEVAQALEDVLGRDAVIEQLRAKCSYAVPNPMMERRRELLKDIPFRAVLTTNYDRMLKGEIPEPSTYRQLLRSVHTPWIDTLYVTAKDRKQRPLLKLHSDLDDPQTIVMTRRDYRRLLYENPNYLSFLRAYLVSHTVLYLGFSFTDAYLNELRS
ncbi:MAG: SIR2 family protein [Gammaproteobacteria bacterium]